MMMLMLMLMMLMLMLLTIRKANTTRHATFLLHGLPPNEERYQPSLPFFKSLIGAWTIQTTKNCHDEAKVVGRCCLFVKK